MMTSDRPPELKICAAIEIESQQRARRIDEEAQQEQADRAQALERIAQASPQLAEHVHAADLRSSSSPK